MEKKNLYSWIRRLKIVKMIIFPELTYRFNIIPVKFPNVFFLVETYKLIIKLIWICNGSKRVKTTLKKKNKVKRLTFFKFKTSFKATVINVVWY